MKMNVFSIDLFNNKILTFLFVVLLINSFFVAEVCAAAGPIRINGNLISASIQEVSGPSTVRAGEEFNVRVKVKNEGDRAFGGKVRLQLVGVFNGQNVVLAGKTLKGQKKGVVWQRNLKGRFSFSGDAKYFVRVRQVNQRKNLVISDQHSITVTETLENRKLVYVHRGEVKSFNLGVKKSLNDYLSRLPRPHPLDFTTFDNAQQKPELKKLSNLIRKRAQRYIATHPVKVKKLNLNEDDEAARIAIAVVQRIRYRAGGNRYPYEVLYDRIGDCDEKSRLLAYLLKDLGFGVRLYEFPNHLALGIKCSREYGYRNTDYCFMEATAPSIVTYVSTVSRSNPTTYNLADGKSFEASREYKNAQEYRSLFFKSLYVGSPELKRKNQLIAVYGLTPRWQNGNYIY